MNTFITNSTLITPFEIVDKATIEIQTGLIKKIITGDVAIPGGAQVVDAGGDYVCPGLIDIHFHGALGKDTMDSNDRDVMKVLAQFCVQHGVTSFYPTTWSAPQKQIIDAIANIKEHMNETGGAQILGAHLEGPYLNMEYKGAQSPKTIRTPDEQEYCKWFDSGIVKIITCAPEIDKGFDFIEAAAARGIRLAIGHSGASFEDVIHAADLGVTQATHLFNGMPGIHHRKPGPVVGILNDNRIFAQIICDGIHLHPAIISMVINAKTPGRTILISDSIRGTGLPDGTYDNNGQIMKIEGGIARTAEGGLSGSTIMLDNAIQYLRKNTSMDITHIVQMATSTPALEMDLFGKKGILREQADADLVIFNKDFEVQKTIVAGKCLYSRDQ